MKDTQFDRKMKIAKLIVSMAVPVMIGVCGYFVQRSIAEFEFHGMVLKEISVKLANRRLLIYDKIKEPLNQIYCYIEGICDWETMSVEDVKEKRKIINRIMYSDRAIWSAETFQLYIEYIDHVAFQRQDDEQDARIRAEINLHRKASARWSYKSATLLTGEKSVKHREMYRQLSDALAADLIT